MNDSTPFELETIRMVEEIIPIALACHLDLRKWLSPSGKDRKESLGCALPENYKTSYFFEYFLTGFLCNKRATYDYVWTSDVLLARLTGGQFAKNFFRKAYSFPIQYQTASSMSIHISRSFTLFSLPLLLILVLGFR